MTLIDDAKLFPCPGCGVHMGQECYPRDTTDANWVHSFRMQVMAHNRAMVVQLR